MKTKWLCLSASLFAGCGDDGVGCLAYATAGLSVSVTNAAGGQAICDAVVTATKGGYSERLYENACTFSGAYERPGTYVVRATRPGFHPNEVAAVHVVMGGGECPHVQPARVTIVLTPVESARLAFERAAEQGYLDSSVKRRSESGLLGR